MASSGDPPAAASGSPLGRHAGLVPASVVLPSADAITPSMPSSVGVVFSGGSFAMSRQPSSAITVRGTERGSAAGGVGIWRGADPSSSSAPHPRQYL
jgi:hypothetical protein